MGPRERSGAYSSNGLLPRRSWLILLSAGSANWVSASRRRALHAFGHCFMRGTRRRHRMRAVVTLSQAVSAHGPFRSSSLSASLGMAAAAASFTRASWSDLGSLANGVHGVGRGPVRLASMPNSASGPIPGFHVCEGKGFGGGEAGAVTMISSQCLKLVDPLARAGPLALVGPHTRRPGRRLSVSALLGIPEGNTSHGTFAATL